MIVINDKPIDKEELVEEYASRILHDMDIDTLMQLAYDLLVAEKIDYEDGQLLAEVEEYYPEILESYYE
jgi:hypothetical protein